MNQENRQEPRFKEIGKVFSSELCALAGILDDISASGCKVHYAYPVVVDLDAEYNVEISPASHYGNHPLKLRCKPQWVTEKEGCTFIGFATLYSPDSVRLAEFIDRLKASYEDPLSGIIQ